MSQTETKSRERLSDRFDAIIAKRGVVEHSFFERFGEGGLSSDELRRFATQWYKTIEEHKKAFPGLVYNTSKYDSRIATAFLGILFDEYGGLRTFDSSGLVINTDYRHTDLFLRVPLELGLTKEQIDQTATISGVADFGRLVDRFWLNGSLGMALGIAFVFESIGADFHEKLYEGLRKSGKISENGLSYSRMHSQKGGAEDRHKQTVSDLLELYSGKAEELDKGVDKGCEILLGLWSSLEGHVFGSSLKPQAVAAARP